MKLRSIAASDWQSILTIQDECYAGILPESLEVLQHKWQVSPMSCFVIESEAQVVGYCLAHPWRIGLPPALDSMLDNVGIADTLYLHDIALSVRTQGKGAGKMAFNKLIQVAAQMSLPSISLVAVQGAKSYWQKQGFIQRQITKSLASYTDDACYMVLDLSHLSHTSSSELTAIN